MATGVFVVSVVSWYIGIFNSTVAQNLLYKEVIQNGRMIQNDSVKVWIQ